MSQALGEMSMGSFPLLYRAKGVNLNGGSNTDVATITGLPARYRILRVMFENASGTPTLATVDLRTAAAGGGAAVVAAQALAALNSSTKFLDATLAIASDVLTATSLTIRNVVAAGSAITVDVTIEVIPLV